MIPTDSLTIKPFKEVPKQDWILAGRERADRLSAFLSDDFTVQSFTVEGGIVRLAIHSNRTIFSERLFEDGINWSTLQAIKEGCGYRDRCGIEIFPPDQHVLNIMNVRHLWLFPPTYSPLPCLTGEKIDKVLGSEEYRVRSCSLEGNFRRLCVQCNAPDRIEDDIAWDTLQAIKEGCGYGDRSAFEYYPISHDRSPTRVRNLWLPPKRFAFEWDLDRDGKTINTGWE